MGDNKKAPRDHFSLDEILAEARTLESKNQKPAPVQNAAKAEHNTVPNSAREVSLQTSNVTPDKKERAPSLFKRRRRRMEIPELEEDIYYGLQLKTLEDYEKTIQVDTKKTKKAESDSVFSYLFTETDDNSVDNEISKQFERLHNERKLRVEKIMQQTGMNSDEIFSMYQNNNSASKPNTPAVSPAVFPAAQPVNPPDPEEEPVTEPQQPPGAPPAPVPNPGPSPAPRPEIEPGPPLKPEIREPITEPAFQPAPAPLTTPMQPDSVPEIRYQADDEPVKEPIRTPQVKEELPPSPPVREPQTRPAPQSVRNASQSYRAASGIPIHMIPLNDCMELLSNAAQGYPPSKPKLPPEPIPISKTATEPVSGIIEDTTVEQEANAPVFSEQTIEFKAIRSDKPDASAAVKPIPFPEPVIPAQELEEENPFEAQNQPAEKPAKRKRFHLFGNEEEDNDTSDNLPGEQEELDDYSSPSDAPSIFHELGCNIRTLYLRLAVTGISMILLLVLGLLGECSGILPQAIQVTLTSQAYLILNLIFLSLASVFCGITILNGIKAMFTFQANADSAVAVADVAAIVQSVALMFSQESVQSAKLHLYSVLVVLALFLNTIGKLSMVKRINRNFRFVAAPDQKQAVQLFDDHNTALQMAGGCVMDAPVIAFQTKASFLKHFLRLSYEPDPSDQSSQASAPIGFILSLILCIVTLVLSKDVFSALTAFAAGACVCVPFVNMLSVNLPVNRVSKIAARCGAMIVGYPAIEHFSSTNAVIVDAKDLFPKGTVVLNGIKTFAGQRIDDAIVDATALMCAVGGPLSDLFDQIIKSRRDMLPKIDNAVYEDEKGVAGWVSDRRILVGNRELMEAHQIEPPSRDYEEKYIHGGKKIVYLASGGDLVAMFIVSYNSDRRRAMELRRMENNGISLIVRTCDPNITPHFLTECFRLDEHSVRVLPERLGSVYTGITSAPQERTPALMATKGRSTAMMRLLTACVRQRSNISIAVALQNVAVVLGFLLVAFLTCYSGLQQLTTTALFIYELFWIAAILLAPRIRKP